MRLFDPEPEAAPTGPLRRVMLLVAYDGRQFHGFAAQPGQHTVGGALGSLLSAMTGEEVAIVCAGRTDAGVHATGQVAHADLEPAFVERLLGAGTPATPGRKMATLAPSLSSQLGRAASVLEVRVAPDGFHARHSALTRRYRYDIVQSAWCDPLEAATAWHVAKELDLSAMRAAADMLVGEHDFSAFCRRIPGTTGPVTRRVLAATVSPVDARSRTLRFEIEANAFCHRMVRSLVGTLVAIGEGRLVASEMLAILKSADRARCGRTAPPDGLVLTSVGYPPELVPGGHWLPGSVWPCDDST